VAGRAGRENTEYAEFASRVVAAFASRVGEGDIDSLAALVELRAQLDDNIAAAVADLRAAPNLYSWAQIAERLGITRQAAMQRWPARDKTTARQPGGQPLGVR
jgi:hypothetical protein